MRHTSWEGESSVRKPRPAASGADRASADERAAAWEARAAGEAMGGGEALPRPMACLPMPPRAIRARSLVAGTAAVRQGALRDLSSTATAPQRAAEADELDRAAAMILSAMEAALQSRLPRLTPAERRLRRSGRLPFRARAELRLWADGRWSENRWSDGTPTEAWTLFLRDIDARAMGFISPDRLPLGHGGSLRFTAPNRRAVKLDVTLTRCSECCGGWYEGALHFNRPQPWLVEDVAEALMRFEAK